MELGDGSAVRLTVSRYYTPTGRSIQRSYENGNNNYYEDYFDRLESGELLDSVKMKVADSLKFKTPKGKTVYGGGGIIPDIFVPLDNSMHNETLRFLQRRGFISYFVFEELEKDRERFADFTQEEFIKDFVVSDDFVLTFQDYLNIRTDSEITFVAYHKEIKQYIKATLADQLFGSNAFQEIINQNDIMIDEVLKYSEQH